MEGEKVRLYIGGGKSPVWCSFLLPSLLLCCSMRRGRSAMGGEGREAAKERDGTVDVCI